MNRFLLLATALGFGLSEDVERRRQTPRTPEPEPLPPAPKDHSLTIVKRATQTPALLGLWGVPCPRCGAGVGIDCDSRTLGRFHQHKARADLHAERSRLRLWADEDDWYFAERLEDLPKHVEAYEGEYDWDWGGPEERFCEDTSGRFEIQCEDEHSADSLIAELSGQGAKGWRDLPWERRWFVIAPIEAWRNLNGAGFFASTEW